MYWSGWEPEVTLGLVGAAGLQVVRSEVETVVEDGDDVQFLWVVGRRPGCAGAAQFVIRDTLTV